ncbi:MAG: hypothetical protein LBD24_01395, partial [Spirochaetaceae bacterium]|nr:hypothetical protein [Spirochaetaceae bacterium]
YNTPPAKFPPSPTVLNNFLPPAAEAQKLPAERDEQRLSADGSISVMPRAPNNAPPLTTHNNAALANRLRRREA